MKIIFLALLSFVCWNSIAQNVGVNNINPDKSLDVIGTTEITRSSSSANPQLELVDTGDGYSRLKFSGEESVTDNFWLFSGRTFQSNDPSSRFNLYYRGDTVTGDLLTVRGTGRTGINVTNPSDRLHINSKEGENAFRVQVNNFTKLRVLANGGISVGTNSPSAVPNNGMYVSGNVGLGVSDPDEKLAVDGNVQIEGEIITNGQSGAQGQILVADGVGNMSWTNQCHYNNFQNFHYTGGSENWTVPDGITKVLVEVWGAGGSGARGGGGGSGAYVKALIDVSEGEVFTIGVGKGGLGVSNGQAVNGNGGSTSELIGSGVTIAAGGGSGATQTSWGGGGTTSVLPSSTSSISQDGNQGMPIEEIPIYSGYVKLDLGRGGSAYGYPMSGGKGEVHSGSGSSTIFNEGTSGSVPGGGGGGGDQFGNDGANGYIIIRW